MSAVSEIMVREYFELHEFLVRQQRKYIAQTKREEDDIDFFVLNPRPAVPHGQVPFILRSEDLPAIQRAIVVVKGWHTETFSSARLASTPGIFRFVSSKAFEQAAKAFGETLAPLRILVVPSLPQTEEAHAESIALLRNKGVDAVIPFQTMLADLVAKVEANRNYQKSDLLQTIRILKHYGFFKEPQMELFRARGRTRKR